MELLSFASEKADSVPKETQGQTASILKDCHALPVFSVFPKPK